MKRGAALPLVALLALTGAGCSYLARPVGAPVAQLDQRHQLLAVYGGAIETSRRSLAITTEAVGLALSRGVVTVDQVRAYRDAAVAADDLLTSAALALQAAVAEPGVERQGAVIRAVADGLSSLARAVELARSYGVTT